MANIRYLKDRIKAVGNICQITRAMEMVATTKLRRFQSRAEASGPYAREIEGLVETLGAGADLGGEGGHPLFAKRDGKRTAILIVTSDRGLCGAYNANAMLRLRDWEAANSDRELHRFVIGKKGMSYLHRRNLEVDSYLEKPSLEQMGYADAARVAQLFVREVTEDRLDEVFVLYTAFKSMTRYEPTVFPFLPLGQADDGVEADAQDDAPASGSGANILLQPSSKQIFDRLVPKYLESRMFNVLIESLTSEYASRRVSMTKATDAATDMVGELKRHYNRARQERITKELLEIVGGAEALNG